MAMNCDALSINPPSPTLLLLTRLSRKMSCPKQDSVSLVSIKIQCCSSLTKLPWVECIAMLKTSQEANRSLCILLTRGLPLLALISRSMLFSTSMIILLSPSNLPPLQSSNTFTPPLSNTPPDLVVRCPTPALIPDLASRHPTANIITSHGRPT